MCIFALIDDFGLDLDDRFEDFLNSFLSLHLIDCYNVAGFKCLAASSMDHFHRIGEELFGHFNRHMVSGDIIVILNHQWVEFLHN